MDTPDSFGKVMFDTSQSMLHLPGPTVTLIRQIKLPRIHFDPGSEYPRELVHAGTVPVEVDEARLALTLVGPCAPVSFGFWLVPDKSVPVLVGSWVSSAGSVELGATRKFEADDRIKAPIVVEQYRSLASAVKDWVRVPLSRLNAALRRRSMVDSAVDLRVAMEALFLHDLDDDRGELTLRVRIRAARLLGRDLIQRRALFKLFGDLYALGSTAVHTGRLPPSHGGRSTQTLLEEGYSTVAKAIEEVMSRGPIDWTDVTLS